MNFTSLINISVIIALAFLGSWILVYVVKELAIKFDVVDKPSDRKVHASATPRGGGLAVVIIWYIGITLLYYLGEIDNELYYALMAGFVLAVVSLIDDIFEVRPLYRLLVQFLVVIGAFYLLGGIRKPITFGIDVLSTPVITYPLAIVGMVWFINLFNFMDGADGIASIQAIIVALTLHWFTGNLELLILAASVLGFLYWNWPKAKIFMGDVGSTQFGFILVVLGLHYHNTLNFSIFNWIMLTSPFWFDATLTLYRRWRNGENLSTTHNKFVFKRYVLAGHSHEQLDFVLILINIVIILLISLYREWDFLKIPIYILTLIFLYMLVRYVDKIFPFAKD